MNDLIKNSLLGTSEDFIHTFNTLSSKEQSNKVYIHILAVRLLFSNFLYHKLQVRALMSGFDMIDEKSALYPILIKPYLKIVDDKSMIAKKYGAMYLMYLGEKSKGFGDEEIIDNIFYSCEKLDFYASQHKVE